jgi:pseudouridine kinase
MNNLDVSGLKVVKKQTGVFDCVLNNYGDLEYAIADMDIFEQEIDSEFIKSFTEKISIASLVFLDGNMNLGAYKKVAEICEKFNVPIVVDPTSVPKVFSFLFSHKEFEIY